MSAFSFPMQDGSGPPQPAPPMGSFTPPGGGPPRPGFPGAPTPPGAPPPAAGSRPNPPPPFQGTMNMGASPAFGAPAVAPAPTPAPAAGAPPPAAGLSATVASAPANKAPPPFPAPSAPGAMASKDQKADEEEHTMVAQPSADLLAATGGGAAVADPAAEWHQVYEEFLKTKRECGEPTDGLTFEKFQQTLKKNRDALIQRHGCKRVKFSVYVKEGRASLKATPVRE
jgi:hypothetical protein